LVRWVGMVRGRGFDGVEAGRRLFVSVW